MRDPFLSAAADVDSISFLDEEQSAVFQELTLQARKALMRAQLDPLKLSSLLEEHGTPVYRLNSGYLPRFILALFQLSPGFIPTLEGQRKEFLFLMLSLIATRPAIACYQPPKNPDVSKEGLFILTSTLFSTGFMAYQLHHWLAYQSGLPGYCEKAQSLYQRFCREHQGKLTPECIQGWNEEDLIALQSAIRQELSALRFFRGLVKDVLFLAQPPYQANFDLKKH